MSSQSKNDDETHKAVMFDPVSRKDLDFLGSVRNSTKLFLGDQRFVGLYEQEAWFDRIKDDPSVKYFVLRAEVHGEGAFTKIGLVRITQIDLINRSACVGGDIHPEFQGKGYGQKMMEAIKFYCFDVLNLRRLWLFVLETNGRARHLYEKAGFEHEGAQKEAIWRNGEYVDYLMMSLIRKEKK